METLTTKLDRSKKIKTKNEQSMLLDSTLVSKRVIDNQNEFDSFIHQMVGGKLLIWPQIPMCSKSLSIYNMIKTHCFYERKDRFEKIIETYLTTQQFSDFQNSFCVEVEKMRDYIELFEFRFMAKKTNILEINLDAKQFRTLISSIIHYLTCLELKKNDINFLTPELLFQKIKNDYDEYQKKILSMKTFNIDIFRHVEIAGKRNLAKIKFIEFLEIQDNGSIIFDHCLFQSQDMLFGPIHNYLNEYLTLKEFQEDLDICWLEPFLEMDELMKEWTEQVQKNLMTLKFTPDPKSTRLAEFLYQITNTLYFVDLELDLQNKNKYKISEGEFKDYLKNVYHEMAKFLKE